MCEDDIKSRFGVLAAGFMIMGLGFRAYGLGALGSEVGGEFQGVWGKVES